MTAEIPAGTAIVFACDEAYFLLARGLVLSLAEAGFSDRHGKLILIDIGCGAASLDWMRKSGVEVVQIPPGLIPASIEAVLRPVQRAQVVRPYLPALLPQFEHFVWFDCDVWVQNLHFLHVMWDGANSTPGAVMLAPGFSHYYTLNNVDAILEMQRYWLSVGYKPKFAETIAVRPALCSGVFAMRRQSSIWELWAREIEYLFPIVAQQGDPVLLHVAEQTALNVVAYTTGNYIRLDPLYNFHCNGGGSLRLPGGKVVTATMLPAREIGVVHLGCWSHVGVARIYIEQNLLYRSGEYLTDAERERILR